MNSHRQNETLELTTEEGAVEFECDGRFVVVTERFCKYCPRCGEKLEL